MGIIYNIWDYEIAHCSNLKEAGLRCGVRDSSIAINYEQDITWTKKQDSADVTFFTDRCLVENIIDRVDSNIKVGWLIEPRAYHPNDYKSVELLDEISCTNSIKLKLPTFKDSGFTEHSAEGSLSSSNI